MKGGLLPYGGRGPHPLQHTIRSNGPRYTTHAQKRPHIWHQAGTPSGCFIVGHDMMVAFHRESQFLLSRRTNRSMVSHFENDQLFRQGRRTMAKAALHIAILAIAVTLSSAREDRYLLRMFQKEELKQKSAGKRLWKGFFWIRKILSPRTFTFIQSAHPISRERYFK